MLYRFVRKISSALSFGFYVQTTAALTDQEISRLRYLLSQTFEPDLTTLVPIGNIDGTVEIGPRHSLESPFSSNAVSICRSIKMESVSRFEKSRIYALAGGQQMEDLVRTEMDRMVEEVYDGFAGFGDGDLPEPVWRVDILGLGKEALVAANRDHEWGIGDEDLAYYHQKFLARNRNPSNVEMFQLSNANSEHSRHPYWKGLQKIDGIIMPETLLEVVQEPLQRLGENRTKKAFNDNSGVLGGFTVDLLIPCSPGNPTDYRLAKKIMHILATAESHNHPTKIAPKPGAETGLGGFLRDKGATGKGAFGGISAAGYFVGNLFLPDYEIPGEVVGRDKPSKYASPSEILIQGSNGVTRYGNEIGEPLTLGFCRTFGQIVDGEWREPRKPVLYCGGVGHIFDEHLVKEEPEVGMLIVRFGGPAYPVGVGGGNASSSSAGSSSEELDHKSVQRGNAEMENKANRVIRTCVEMEEDNPMESIHDQGAGGPSNVLTELVAPKGGRVDIRQVVVGDKSMSLVQIWSAEFQEGYGALVKKNRIDVFRSICARERVNCEVMGEIDGSGNIVVFDSNTGEVVVDLNIEEMLTKFPQKTWESTRREKKFERLEIPENLTVEQALRNVFKLPSVGSKMFVVDKGDRHVTGLVVQQQTCGIAQIPISDYSVNAQSYFGLSGSVAALGEQPIIMLIDPKAGARMSVAEMLTNMAGVKVTSLGDIRCRANWMWPAKRPHEGPLLYDAATAMRDFMIQLGIAIDGGKDSLSMEEIVAGELVKAPGTLVIFGYAPVPDVTKKVTPDIKQPGSSQLALIDLGMGKNRLGASALAQSLNQLGDECPDIDDWNLLFRSLSAIQKMVELGLVLSVHDRSDGGLITAVAEMCMASRCGFRLEVPGEDLFGELFSQELGYVVELPNFGSSEAELFFETCASFGLPVTLIGRTSVDDHCQVMSVGQEVLSLTTSELRLMWESTSLKLEEFQTDLGCVRQEYDALSQRWPGIDTAPSYQLTFQPKATAPAILEHLNKTPVLVLREEGSNGDPEMRGVCHAAGLRPFDVNMDDLLKGKFKLDDIRGLISAGGFSYADVPETAGKGWAATILFHDELREMFDRFYAREDTFSLGVCNGAQSHTLLGWVPRKGIELTSQPRLLRNTCGRFKSSWVQVEVLRSPSILFARMEGSKLGIWVAHGEGRLYYPDPSIADEVAKLHLATLAYVDPNGDRTEQYPFNPNGSPLGVTGLCTADGRHNIMMPHGERCFQLRQWPWMPPAWRKLEASPWLQLFQNARQWCEQN